MQFSFSNDVFENWLGAVKWFSHSESVRVMESGWEGWNLKNPFWKRAVTQLLPSPLTTEGSAPSVQVNLQGLLRDSRRLGSGTQPVWMLLERRNRWGAACGRARFREKSTIKVLKLKGITIILPCGQHAPESFFCGSAPKRKWRAQSRGSQKRDCMPWDVEKVKTANLKWAGFLTSGKPQE